jgi:hypothetical protein
VANMNKRLAIANGRVSTIAGLVADRAVPLPWALSLLEAKADGSLAPGRWFYAVHAPDACVTLDNARTSWARALLGAQSWHNGFAVCWAIGWLMSGMGEAVVEIAMRRAKLWCLLLDDLYGSVFRGAHACASSWSAKSRLLLEDWNVTDFIDGDVTLGTGAYKRYAISVIGDRCMRDMTHGLSAKYSLLRDTMQASSAGTNFFGCKVQEMQDWHVLVGMRARLRLVLGILPLAHKACVSSSARDACCIACNKRTASPITHSVLVCEKWALEREPLKQAPCWGSEVTGRLARVLRLRPMEPAFDSMISLVSAIDDYALQFWKDRGRRNLKLLSR